MTCFPQHALVEKGEMIWCVSDQKLYRLSPFSGERRRNCTGSPFIDHCGYPISSPSFDFLALYVKLVQILSWSHCILTHKKEHMSNKPIQTSYDQWRPNMFSWTIMMSGLCSLFCLQTSYFPHICLDYCLNILYYSSLFPFSSITCPPYSAILPLQFIFGITVYIFGVCFSLCKQWQRRKAIQWKMLLLNWMLLCLFQASMMCWFWLRVYFLS